MKRLEYGTEVTHIEVQGSRGYTEGYIGPSSHMLLVRWLDRSSVFSKMGNGLSMHDQSFIRPVYAPPAPAVCHCPIKDLTSVGHTDPQCPERKK